AQNQVFEQISALTYANFNLTGTGEPERIQGALVSHNFFQTLGVQPTLGRAFTPEEEKPATERVALISHELWQKHFGGDRSVVGRRVTFNGEPFTIVGIMPAGFQVQFPTTLGVQIWTPLRVATSDTNRVSHYLYVLARLREGVTLEQAQTAMNVIASRLKQQYPDTNGGSGVNIVPLQHQLVGGIQPYVQLLFAAVGFVLLIVCANLANLFLARLTGRRKEVAVRLALGAGRSRIVRQFLVESLLLSALGGLLGLLIAAYGIGALRALAPPDLPRINEVALSAPAFLWTGVILILTGVTFGLTPALRASRTEITGSLQAGDRVAGSAQQNRFSQFVVSAEIALAILLLVGAGLMIRSSMRLQQVDPGFQEKDLLTLNVALPRQKYPEASQASAFFDRLLERVRNLPGVIATGGVDPLPMSGSDGTTGVLIEGQSVETVANRPEVGERRVTPGYFQTMGIPLLSGRSFSHQDRADTPAVLIVNQALARQFFPEGRALGKRLGLEENGKIKWAEIVGVVGNIRHRRLDDEIKPELYEPYHQSPGNFMSVVVRTAVEPTNSIAAVREEVRQLDPDQPIFEIKTMEERLAETLAQGRFVMTLMAIFAALALALAVIGIYGVMACFVGQRRKEIGIRFALGAQKSDILRWVIAQGMSLAAIGVAIGLSVSFGLTRIIATLLFGVGPTDPVTFAIVSILLGGVALLACSFPALRASRVDPIMTLKAE
ncbi:MAG TPA: ABC transporter permease, partial [Chthoniobacterales bacterium]|nr:ABC transporter permease [Chthoniobacterales bacterium]